MGKFPSEIIAPPGHQSRIDRLAGRNWMVTAHEPFDLTQFAKKELEACVSLKVSLEEGYVIPYYNEPLTPPPPPPIPIPTLRPATDDKVAARIRASVTESRGRGSVTEIDTSEVADVLPELATKQAQAAEKDATEKQRIADRAAAEAQRVKAGIPKLTPEGADKIPKQTPPGAKKKKTTKKKTGGKKTSSKKTTSQKKTSTAKKKKG